MRIERALDLDNRAFEFLDLHALPDRTALVLPGTAATGNADSRIDLPLQGNAPDPRQRARNPGRRPARVHK
jgi:hypothetical protein